METQIGIKGKDFVILAADSYSAVSIFRMKSNDDKLLEVDNNKILGCSGSIGDRNKFGEYIRKCAHLYRIRSSYSLSTKSTANYLRLELANYLRTNPYQCDFLLAGYDTDDEGPLLYWVDYLASLVSVEKAAHGYAAYFVLGILDKYYKPDLSEEEALDILRKCAKELNTRFVISQTNFVVKIIDKSQKIRTIEL